MKIFVLFLASSSLAMAFQQVILPATTTSRVTSTLKMGFLDNMFPNKNKQDEEAAPAPVAQKSQKRSKTAASNSRWIENMFKSAFHGHGSAEDELDDMYLTQQKMLEERRELFGDSGHGMKDKYRDTKVDHLRDIPTHEHDPAMLNQKEDDAMYFDDNDKNTGGGGFNFPSWPGSKSKLQP